MPARELDEWIAYFEIHPIPDAQWDAAQICSVLANVNGNRKNVADFLPRPIAGQGPRQSTEDMMAAYYAGI